MTADANPPCITARASALGSLVVVLIAVLSLAGGEAVAGTSATVGSHLASAALEEAPVTATVDVTERRRSGVRRRSSSGLALIARGIVAAHRRAWRRGWALMRCIPLTTAMWRGPPPLRL